MDTLYTIFTSAHSGLRWIALLLLVLTVAGYLVKWQRGADYRKGDRTLFTIMLSFMHIQVLLGVVLYFISPNVQFGSSTMSTKIFRFFTIEHALLMLLAIVLITMASSKMKKKDSPKYKFKTGFWYSFIALVLILAGIPWPFYGVGAGWF
jgi:heme A synthase